MKKTVGFFAIILLTMPLFGAGSNGNSWEFEFEDDGIKVYSRSIPGRVIREFKGVAVINSKIEVIGEVFQDIKAMPEWMPDCEEVKIVKEVNSEVFHIIVYTVTNSPWPVRDRDAVADTVLSIDPGTGNLVATVTAIKEPLVPLKDYHVRITDLKQQFIFEHLENKKTRVVCTLMVDPGGYVPKFFTNIVVKRWPYNVLVNLKDIAGSTKYIKAAEANKNSDMARVIAKKMYEGKIRKNVKDKMLVKMLFKDDDLFKLVFNSGQYKKEPIEILEEHIKSNYYKNNGRWHRK